MWGEVFYLSMRSSTSIGGRYLKRADERMILLVLFELGTRVGVRGIIYLVPDVQGLCGGTGGGIK